MNKLWKTGVFPNIIVKTDVGVYVNKLSMHNIKTQQFIENFGELPNIWTKPIFHVSNAYISIQNNK